MYLSILDTYHMDIVTYGEHYARINKPPTVTDHGQCTESQLFKYHNQAYHVQQLPLARIYRSYAALTRNSYTQS
jgi:hypothetical protein